MMISGIVVTCIFGKKAIISNEIYQSIFKIVAGLLLMIPGTYNTTMAFMIWWHQDQSIYNYESIAQFESDLWW